MHICAENSRVACDPPDVGHAGELVVWVHIEDVLDGQRGTQQVATSGMNDTLGLTGGTRRLEITPTAPIRISGSIYTQKLSVILGDLRRG